MRSPFRVKPYAHSDYKFVVRTKRDGKWVRRYFRSEQEAAAYADEHNRAAMSATPARSGNGDTNGSAETNENEPQSSENGAWAHTRQQDIPKSRSDTGDDPKVKLEENLARATEARAALEEKLAMAERDIAELIDSRWEVLTLRADLLRGKDGAAEANARVAELQDRLNAASGERDQLRRIILEMEKDLEQERLNIAALEHRLRLSEERAEELEEAGVRENRLNSHEEVNALEQRLFAVEDRARLAETNLRKSELRLATTEDQLRTVRGQWSAAQEQLRATAKELASRRAQIIQLRERLARRLILPFGKMQRRIEELTS